MKFKEKLLQGTLIKDIKDFVDIEHKNRIITAHCPNSGSMMGLLNEGNKVLFSDKQSKRKLKYTLEMINMNNKLVGINTLIANKIVFEALVNKKIKALRNFDEIKKEVKFSTKQDLILVSK